MKSIWAWKACIATLAISIGTAACAGHGSDGKNSVELGPRPYYLVADMDEGPLKQALQDCASRPRPQQASDFSIGHRGAPLQFPEHTEESYRAAARMGAGIVECDVAFTKDRELVCRHSQCDLHTTTNILDTDLADQCSEPFSPFDGSNPASARCCTSDITLAQFKTLTGKMDGANPRATTVEEYLKGTAGWRTDLYSQSGTLLSHRESIALFQELGVKMTPELKAPQVSMPYQGEYRQQDYAKQLIDEYRQAGVPPRDVFPQSFNLEDVRYWIGHHPRYGQQAVYLDGRDSEGLDPQNPGTWQPDMDTLAGYGVNIIAPPLWMLVTVDERNRIVPSPYARAARAAGLDIIAWSLERSGPLANGGGWYYQSVQPAINNDGDTFTLLDVLARDVGVIGVFSDWPATTSFYASCQKFLHAKRPALP
ncbi:MAG: glycerophosphoryl diester phosphodiesterase [Alcanivorax sp.]|jgi:glycerophosphoryl diester phosphodiesterase|uniref:glycerophosphodiester phosphodiesterase family protein n=1 Tax=Alcanivorax sp. TaxID=1872427 RepID=UPI0039E65BE1